ncbi:small RNA-binding protein 11, chloroplastic [Macadamia integrifolia]|uniref:small RNA-binding protein 11, chloroplastic n=1 Tax=Macadamia integrifolia TaxID=60698 RepID=UPI001C501D19|nr:small RNA-binding protein 11, chloroplastic [Macadamia integrifolia]
MAAYRRIPQLFRHLSRSDCNSSSFRPSLFICNRGISSKLFVGGLSYYTTENGLSEAFSQYGQVIEATIVMDRVSDRSKGFGFVTFASEDEAANARAEMDGKTLNGRVIFVDIAKSKNSKEGLPIARGPPERSIDT